MPLLDLTNENFDTETDRHEMMILDFWSPTCGPCQMFAPTFAAASIRHPDILFGRINTEDEKDLAQQFAIFSVPTLITARGGTIRYARPGALSEAKLEAVLAELRAEEER